VKTACFESKFASDTPLGMRCGAFRFHFAARALRHQALTEKTKQ
jgi:hypothetical protein